MTLNKKMDNSSKIKQYKELRVKIKDLMKQVEKSENELATPVVDLINVGGKVLESLQMGRMWLGMCLQGLNDKTPYIHSDNKDNDIVLPEADRMFNDKKPLTIISINKDNQGEIKFSQILEPNDELVIDKYIYKVVSKDIINECNFIIRQDGSKNLDIVKGVINFWNRPYSESQNTN